MYGMLLESVVHFVQVSKKDDSKQLRAKIYVRLINIRSKIKIF